MFEMFRKISGNFRENIPELFRTDVRRGKDPLEWQRQGLRGGGCLDSFPSLAQESVPNLTIPFGFQLSFFKQATLTGRLTKMQGHARSILAKGVLPRPLNNVALSEYQHKFMAIDHAASLF